MITYLPEIYPDELAYSWFCRYFVHSGYLTHKAALQDILQNRHNNPSKEFLGHLTPDILTAIKRMYPIDKIIIEHTMFPQYARFIPLEQRKNALYSIGNDFCDVHHLFAVLPRSDSDIYLKYCPMCVKEDREKHGETYWHRTHQLRNITVCSKHNCKLISSEVTAKSEQTFTFCPAEEYVTENEPIVETDSLMIDFCKYSSDVFSSKIDMENDISIKAILYSAMKDNGYVSATGKTRHIKRLADDLKAFYEGIGINDIASFHQVQRVLHGDRFDFTVICQIAYFLNLDMNILTNHTLTKDQIEWERNTHHMKDKTKIDWSMYDQETAPLLENTLRDIYEGKANKKGRPERVSKRMVYKLMGFPQHRLEKLPECNAVFQKYSETYEENWARRIIWAYDKLKKEGKPFYWTDIRDLTGVKREYMDKVIPLIKKNYDKEYVTDGINLICGEPENECN